MILDSLSGEERDLVRRAMGASADGPFFPDWEFETLFGITRVELKDALRRFPALEGDEDFRAVNNSLLWLVSYPHKRDDEMKVGGLDPHARVDLHKKWLRALGKPTNEFLDFVA